MSEPGVATLSTAVSLASLWSAMSPRPRPAVPAAPDVGAIAAAADARGFARGQAEAEAALLPAQVALAAALDGLEAARAIDPETLRPLFVDLVTRVATAVIEAELKVSLAVVARLVDAALGAIEHEGAVVHVCPEHAVRLDALPDPDLAPGEVRIETPLHVVAESLAGRLAAVVADLA